MEVGSENHYAERRHWSQPLSSTNLEKKLDNLEKQSPKLEQQRGPPRTRVLLPVELGCSTDDTPFSNGQPTNIKT